MNVATTFSAMELSGFNGVLQIGNDRNIGARNWAGRIGEILTYQRLLTAVERNVVERWLGARWGILSKIA